MHFCRALASLTRSAFCSPERNKHNNYVAIQKLECIKQIQTYSSQFKIVILLYAGRIVHYMQTAI